MAEAIKEMLNDRLNDELNNLLCRSVLYALTDAGRGFEYEVIKSAGRAEILRCWLSDLEKEA